MGVDTQINFYSKRRQIVSVTSVHTTPKKFENIALFLKLGLPSILIRRESGAFGKRSSDRRNLKTQAFRFRAERKLLKTEFF